MTSTADARPIIRDRQGRIQAGSGAMNPGGRPPLDQEVREILQAAAPQAAKKLVELAFHAEDARVSLAAITVLMDRLFGKPAQQISADIKTTDIGRMHLEALQSLQARRDARLLEIAKEEGSA